MSEEKKNEDFWYDVEMMLYTACWLYEGSKTDGTPKKYENVYNMVNDNKPEQLDRLFKALPEGHPAKKPYSSFANASDTVRTGAILGLVGRLQVFHDRQLHGKSFSGTVVEALPCIVKNESFLCTDPKLDKNTMQENTAKNKN